MVEFVIPLVVNVVLIVDTFVFVVLIYVYILLVVPSIYDISVGVSVAPLTNILLLNCYVPDQILLLANNVKGFVLLIYAYILLVAPSKYDNSTGVMVVELAVIFPVIFVVLVKLTVFKNEVLAVEFVIPLFLK